MSIVLIGALGFAIDGSQLFAQHRMAQAAADAAAQAAIMSVYDNTNGSGSSHHFATSVGVHTCGSSDPTPCYYAQTLNGFSGTTCPATLGNDCVTWESDPADVNAPNLSSENPNRIRVTVSRVVPTALMRFFGASSATISARGTAAILSNATRAQIIVTGSGPGTFSLASGASLAVSGGANRVIQVNSSDSGAVDASGGTVNLTSGADFGVWGGPNTVPFTLSAGTYVQPGSPIPNPLAGLVTPPSQPGNAPSPVPNIPSGSYGCVSIGPGGTCTLYSPGRYRSDINVTNQTALFKPGIYYMSRGASFVSGPNGYMQMASGTGADDGSGTNTGWTGNMLVYLAGGGSVNIGSGGTINLTGAPFDSAYRGILFYAGTRAATHTFDTTGDITLAGTVYFSNSSQTLNLQGTRFLTITGDILVNRLAVSGSPSVSFPGGITVYNTSQVALIN